MKYRKGAHVAFTAQRPCVFRHRRIRTGETASGVLIRDWDDQEQISGGGPFGWGGYSSRHVNAILRDVEIR